MLEAYTTLGYLAARTSTGRAAGLGHRGHLPGAGACWPSWSPRWTCCPRAGPGSASAPPGTTRRRPGSACRSRPPPSGSSGWRRRCRSACRCGATTTARTRARTTSSARTLNVPQPLTRPHPPILIGGGGEKKTLRLVAQYAQACNLFPSPDLERKLDVLRGHCEAVGRDYDDIEKTVMMPLDVGETRREGRRPARAAARAGRAGRGAHARLRAARLRAGAAAAARP